MKKIAVTVAVLALGLAACQDERTLPVEAPDPVTGVTVTFPDGRRLNVDGKNVVGGVIFRTNLDLTGLEILATNHRNQVESAVDAFGNASIEARAGTAGLGGNLSPGTVLTWSSTPVSANPTAPVYGENCSVMTDRWRLVNDKELFDIEADRAQEKNLAAQQPEVVAKMRAHYEKWWAGVEPRLNEFYHVSLGAPQENPVTLTAVGGILGVLFMVPLRRSASSSSSPIRGPCSPRSTSRVTRSRASCAP